MLTVEEAQEEILMSEVVPSETIRTLYQTEEISKYQVKELLEWSGDDEYVTVEEITD